jgi:hypothetical protein
MAQKKGGSNIFAGQKLARVLTTTSHPLYFPTSSFHLNKDVLCFEAMQHLARSQPSYPEFSHFILRLVKTWPSIGFITKSHIILAGQNPAVAQKVVPIYSGWSKPGQSTSHHGPLGWSKPGPSTCLHYLDTSPSHYSGWSKPGRCSKGCSNLIAMVKTWPEYFPPRPTRMVKTRPQYLSPLTGHLPWFALFGHRFFPSTPPSLFPATHQSY